MKKILENLNKMSEDLLEKTGNRIVAVRIFSNCLCVYFDKGSCRFYSKKNFDWGKVGKIYFSTFNFERKDISKKLWEEFENLIKWYEEWKGASYIHRLHLLLEYNIKYA